jgi:ribonuclease VapC
MIIDSSALVAIITDEPEAERMTRSIARSGTRLVSAGNALEAGIVIEARLGEVGGRDLDLYLHKLGIEVVTFTPRQANLARKAYRQFGKGRHPAGLNFGDCITYALARDTGEPLLFKGNDFTRTDVIAAAY